MGRREVLLPGHDAGQRQAYIEVRGILRAGALQHQPRFGKTLEKSKRGADEVEDLGVAGGERPRGLEPPKGKGMVPACPSRFSIIQEPPQILRRCAVQG